MKWIYGLLTLIMALFLPNQGNCDLFLRDKMRQAKQGDYIVATINNCYNVLLIRDKSEDWMTIEEITVPQGHMQASPQGWLGWKYWVESGAPGHASWVMYKIHLPTGQMQEYYSYTQNSWGNVNGADNFLSKLLSLRLTQVPRNKMKKIGPRPSDGFLDKRRVWQPKMTFEGSPIQGVAFNAWKTQWPADNTEMSKKVVIVYLPEDDDNYPSYFPYSLQIHGWTGKAKIHIVDSGRNLTSPAPPPPRF